MKVSGDVPPPLPVPVNPTNCGLKAVPSVSDRAPLTDPFAFGENVTAMLHFAFDASDPPQVVPVELTP